MDRPWPDGDEDKRAEEAEYYRQLEEEAREINSHDEADADYWRSTND